MNNNLCDLKKLIIFLRIHTLMDYMKYTLYKTDFRRILSSVKEQKPAFKNMG